MKGNKKESKRITNFTKKELLMNYFNFTPEIKKKNYKKKAPY